MFNNCYIVFVTTIETILSNHKKCQFVVFVYKNKAQESVFNENEVHEQEKIDLAKRVIDLEKVE